MTRERRRPGGQTGAGDTIGEIQASVHRQVDTPVVRGWVYGPHAGRRRNMILVRCCVYCEKAHRHTSEILAASYTRHCPVTGESYTVRAVVEPDTRKAVSRAA